MMSVEKVARKDVEVFLLLTTHFGGSPLVFDFKDRLETLYKACVYTLRRMLS